MTARPRWMPNDTTLPASWPVAIPAKDAPRLNVGGGLAIVGGTAIKQFAVNHVLWLSGRPHIATSKHAIDRARFVGATAILYVRAIDRHTWLFSIDDPMSPYRSPRFEPQLAHDLTQARNRIPEVVT